MLRDTDTITITVIRGAGEDALGVVRAFTLAELGSSARTPSGARIAAALSAMGDALDAKEAQAKGATND